MWLKCLRKQKENISNFFLRVIVGGPAQTISRTHFEKNTWKSGFHVKKSTWGTAKKFLWSKFCVEQKKN